MRIFFRALRWVLIVGPMCAFGSPALKAGVYRAAELGLLEVSATGSKVLAKFRSGGNCNFGVDDEVLSGAFEGDVFVGTIALCQTGEGCAGSSKLYPLLAIYSQKELTGEVPLPTGCTSPGLVEGHRFTLKEASADEAKQAQASVKSIVVPKALNKKDREVLADKSFKNGSEHFNRGRYRLAADAFDVALTANGENANYILMLGICKVKLGQWPDGHDNITRGLKQGGRGIPPELRALATYALAVAAENTHQRPEAWKLFQSAVSMSNQPSGMLQELKADPDLKNLRTDPEFKPQIEELEKAIAAKVGKKPKGG